MRTLIWALVWSWLLAADVWAAEGWQAGWSRANITPEEPMWMAGYGGRDHPAEGKLTDLWAKTLVLQDPAGRRVVLITLDLVGIGRDVAVPLCADLQQKFGLERSQIAICTSHTHTGPAVGTNLGPMHYYLIDKQQQTLIENYAATLRAKIVATVEQASNQLAPCRLSWGSGKTTFAVNRRTNREAEVPAQRDIGGLVGPVDHDVPVLTVRDPAGKLRVVVFGYACHSTVLSFYQWSGDYPGFAQLELEAEFPDCQAMFWAGCGADQNPLPRRTVEIAQAYGRRLALAVSDVVTAPMEELQGNLETRYDEIPLALATLPTHEELTQQSQASDRFVASRAKMWLDRIAAGESLPATYPYPVQSWRWGQQCEWVILGGEVVVDYAVRIKRERLGTRTWVAGYSNDVMAYIPSRRVLLEGGYEGGGAMVYYGLPTTWAEPCEQDILAAIHQQLPAPR